jgi:hypothetical protein
LATTNSCKGTSGKSKDGNELLKIIPQTPEKRVRKTSEKNGKYCYQPRGKDGAKLYIFFRQNNKIEQ